MGCTQVCKGVVTFLGLQQGGNPDPRSVYGDSPRGPRDVWRRRENDGRDRLHGLASWPLWSVETLLFICPPSGPGPASVQCTLCILLFHSHHRHLVCYLQAGSPLKDTFIIFIISRVPPSRGDTGGAKSLPRGPHPGGLWRKRIVLEPWHRKRCHNLTSS